MRLYTGNNLEYKVILFKPQIGFNDTQYRIIKTTIFPQEVPLYGELSFEKFNSFNYYRYYLTIESFEVGDKIYLQLIIKDYDYEHYASPV